MFPVIAESDLQTLHALYERGHYVSAWRHLQTLPPIAQWRQPAPLLIAGRILGNVEARRQARFLHNRAWRIDRRDPETAYYRAHAIQERFGPLRALRFLEALPAFPNAPDELRAHLLAMRADLLCTFRDFTRGEVCWREAEVLDGHGAWIWIERATCLERADDYPGALAAAQHALELRPWYRPAVQAVSHLLGLLGRDEESLALLAEAREHLESPTTVALHAALLTEYERHEEALAAWRQYRELAVAIEAENLEFWHARMADCYCELGQLREAAEHARCAKNGFHEKIASRLANPPAEARIIRLQVPFIRQHELTCAPATLSALSHFWRAPVDHLALAREISYNGTQAHRERQWAEENGYVVRGFTVTWEAARALLDRGVPFTLATVETRSAHLQAIVGYDDIRRTLRIRDPFLKHPREALGEEWLEGYAFCGPRGLALVPLAEAHRLDGLALPDTALYDELHSIERALQLHERPRAAEALARMEANAPGHRLTLEAQRELGAYDGHHPRVLAATEGLLALYPESNALRWARYAMLRDLARHEERRAQLGELARGDATEPFFWRELAEDLRQDARQLPLARQWMLRALRFAPMDAELLHGMAGILWEERRFVDALTLYRLAACLRDKVETFQHSWFLAARYLRQEKEVLDVLIARAERDGARSDQPGRTLFWALTALSRDVEARAALDAAVARRPDDGDLLCFAADVVARYAQADEARALLARAEGHCARLTWLRTAALLADYRSDSREALRLTREALEELPLDLNLHRATARLLAETESRETALDYLRAQIERFPHYHDLRVLFITWARESGEAAAEAPLRELLALDPTNSWATRELALVLAGLNRFDEALQFTRHALILAPRAEASLGIHAHVLLGAGDLAAAAEYARAALRLSVDYASGAATLLAAAPTFSEKKAALAFFLHELETQVVFGDGLLTYVQSAFDVLERDELIANLRAAHASRPDLWHAWSALVTFLYDAERAAEALPMAREAVARFPMKPRLWLDLARVHRSRREFAEEVEALERGRALNPGWGLLSRELSEALQRVERYDDATRVGEEVIAAAPLDPINYCHLAELLWRSGRNARAIDLLCHAIHLEPAYLAAWNHLQRALPPGDGRALELANELTQRRPGEVSSWLRLAEMLPATAPDQRLDAIDRALALNPREVDAYDLRAWNLVEAGRFDEALAACCPAPFGDAPPRELRARAAWVVAVRGNVPEAIKAMQAVVEADPNYYWAWERIAEWNRFLGKHDAERDAAERMTRLNPRSAIPLGYLADAHLKLGKRDEALAVLRRAFALDPSYGFAGYTIFHEALRKNDFAEAGETLRLLQRHLPGPATQASAIALACRHKERAEAFSLFGILLKISQREDAPLREAMDSLRAAGWAVDAEKLIWEQRAEPALNPFLGTIWVRSFTEREAWEHCKKLLKLEPASAFTHHAWRTIAYVYGEKRRRHLLDDLLKQHRAWFQQDTEAWGAVGYALVSNSQNKEEVEWCAGWQERTDLQPWALNNLASALEFLGREDEAMVARGRALTLPRDSTTVCHLARLSLDDALSKRYSEGESRLQMVDPERLEKFPRAHYELAHALCAVAAGSPRDREGLYRSCRDRLLLQHGFEQALGTLRTLFKQVDQAMADLAGVPVRRVKFRNVNSSGTSREFSGGHVLWISIVVIIAIGRCANSSFNTPSAPFSYPRSDRGGSEQAEAKTRAAILRKAEEKARAATKLHDELEKLPTPRALPPELALPPGVNPATPQKLELSPVLPRRPKARK